ncbi:transforming acidic coiled-coil-containing protein 3 [Anomaloglossus baeobatrachus]|uniref:transforming acidic coiled-coil-containing protein 3 n=1 Tax=Anomaloglossus baeobatrachus TaxID=238106 RepID=UPI003F4FA28C
MSLQILNDENFGSDIAAESCDFLFTPPQSTGRPSILRPSQKDNLPPKSAVKGMKVTFQTPMRDPQTHRIVTPSVATKEDSVFTLDDCTDALQKLQLSSTRLNTGDPNITSDPTTLPEDEIPLMSMGAYKIDFDNLGEINPFKSGNKMMNSPVKSEPPADVLAEPPADVLAEPPADVLAEPPADVLAEPPADVLAEPPADVLAEPPADVLAEPPADVLAEPPADVLAEPPADVLAEPPADVLAEPPADVLAEPPADVLAEPPADVLAEPPADVLAEPPADVLAEPPADVLAEPPPELEGKSMSEAPVDTSLADQAMSLLQASPSHLDSPVTVQLCPGSNDISSKVSLDDTVPLTELSPTPEELTPMAANVDRSSPPAETEAVSVDTIAAAMVQNPNSVDNNTSPPDVPNSPPLPKAAYKFDPDQIDCIDPFNTGGSKLQNSPKNLGSEIEAGPKGGPMKLEFDFGGGGDAPVRKPPPKLLGKRLGIKSLPKKKVAPKEAAVPEKPKEQAPPQSSEPGEVIVPKASYNFDWDKFDDPNFNPFGSGGTKIAGSPKVTKAAGDVPSVEKKDCQPKAGEAVEEPNKKGDGDASGNIERSVKQPSAAEEKTGDLTQKVEGAVKMVNEEIPTTQTEEPLTPSVIPEYSALPATMGLADPDFGAAIQMDLSLVDDFKAAIEVKGFDQPIEIDYLENFGSSLFKESALRKQSLFLKFDPLLRESPKKSGAAGPAIACDVAPPSRTELFGDFPEPSFPLTLCLENEEKPKGLDLLGTFNISDDAPLIPDPTHLVPAPDPFLLPSDVGAIVEVLKYSQIDMDAAIEKVRLEVQEKDLEVVAWKNKHKKLYLEYIEMEKIVAEFESTITQMLEDSQRQKELSKQDLHKVVEEKQQVQMDLNSMEKSFSELFKRFEKQKDVLEGYRKNEDALKKCVEDYLARIKKEEQRYQALKAHAEEKLNRANEEIAQVRNKAKAEATALQATLRKEQMKIQSLERSLEQKTKENDELTKICDDLILKMEKI